MPTLPTLVEGNTTTLVDRIIGDAYHVVKEVYVNLGAITSLAEGFNDFEVNAEAAIAAKEEAEEFKNISQENAEATSADRIQTGQDVETVTQLKEDTLNYKNLVEGYKDTVLTNAANSATNASNSASVASASETASLSNAITATNKAAEAAAYAAASATSAKFYDTIALGRADVADTFTFGVKAGGSDGLTRATLYRRDSPTTQTLITDMTTGAELTANTTEINSNALGTQLRDSLPNLLPSTANDFVSTAWTSLSNCTATATTYNSIPCWKLETSGVGLQGQAWIDIPADFFRAYGTVFSFGALVLALSAATSSGSSFVTLTVIQIDSGGAFLSTHQCSELSPTDAGFTSPVRTFLENIAINASAVTLRYRWTFRGVSEVRTLYVRDMQFATGSNSAYRKSQDVIIASGYMAGSTDLGDYTLSKLSAMIAVFGRTCYDPPTALSWPSTYPFRLYTAQNGNYALVINERDFIDSRVWQGAALHVDRATGNDSYSGYGQYDGDFSKATRTISRAIRIGNATGKSYRILVKAGTYDMYEGISAPASTSAGGSGGLANARTTQPCSIIAYGGRVTHSCHATQTWSLYSGTTYQATSSSTGWVINLSSNDVDGVAGVPLTYASSIANCVATAGSWHESGGVTYVNRLDGAAVTNANTRILGWLNNAVFDSTTKDLYIENFDFMGGRYAALDCGDLTTMGTANTVVKNCTMKFAGKPTLEAPAFTVNRRSGFHLLIGCTARRGSTDGFNFHSNLGTCVSMTYNCVATNNGYYSGTSCNAHTGHEDCLGIDINGTYTGGNGGTFHWVQTSKVWVFNSNISGSTQSPNPEEAKCSNTTKMWLENCTISSTGRAIRADGGTVYKRNCTITGAEVSDSDGVITTF